MVMLLNIDTPEIEKARCLAGSDVEGVEAVSGRKEVVDPALL